MRYETKNIFLKNDLPAVLRSPAASDAPKMNAYLKRIAGETDFLIRYPEECTESDEDKAQYLEGITTSQKSLMIVCTIGGEIAGTCQLMFHQRLKTKHRAEVSISVLKKYWGLGIGTALFSEMISIAKGKGLYQLELDYVEGNERACGLYEKMGFVHVGEKPNAIRLKDGTMLKEFSMVKKL